MNARAALIGLSFLFLSACGGQTFSPTFKEHEEPEFSRVMRRLGDVPERKDRAVVAAVTGSPERLVVWDAKTKATLWSQPTSARSAPVLAGDVVLVQEKETILARDVDTGTPRFSIDEDEDDVRLIGADGDGSMVVVSLARGPVETPKGTLLAARDGAIVWTRETDLPIGRPAVANGLVIVPWGTQRVSILDADSGEERSRVRIADDVVGRAFVHGRSVYVGQHGIFRLTPSLQSGSRRASAYFSPKGRSLPGQPPLLPDGYTAVAPPKAVSHRIRLLWTPEGSGEKIQFTDNNLYLVFYRLLFAFDPQSDALRWVYVHPDDIVGGEARKGGVAIAGAKGEVAFIAASTGQKAWQGDADLEMHAADVRLGTMSFPDAGPAATPVPQQLYEAASVDDPRLGAGRALAAKYLAALEGPEVTAQLIELCSNRKAPEPTRITACQGLAERTSGEEHVRAALAKKASFLKDVAPPPVGPLAKAAAKMNLRDQAPRLIEHLQDPATPTGDLTDLIESLKAMQAKNAAPALDAFVRLYRVEATDPALERAIGASADALAELQGAAARPTLELLAEGAMSPGPVKQHGKRALGAIATSPETEPAKPGRGTAPRPGAPEGTAPPTN